MRFDDLAKERVTDVDIKRALKDESPYLLFYQVQLIDEELARGNPPSYAETQSEMAFVDPSLETLTSTDAETTIDGMEWDRSGTVNLSHLDANGSGEAPGRTSMSSNRRSSVTFEDVEGSLNDSTRGRTALTTPVDESRPSFLSTSRRGSKVGKKTGSKSRPTSQSGESRLSLTMSRLTGRKSKDKLQNPDNATSDEPIVTVVSVAEDAPEPAPQPEHHVKHSSLGGSKSTKGKEKKRLRSSSRNPPNTKNHHKKPPDRECIVM
jgi:hypothetical protein